jgi:hypothetical protein
MHKAGMDFWRFIFVESGWERRCFGECKGLVAEDGEGSILLVSVRLSEMGRGGGRVSKKL